MKLDKDNKAWMILTEEERTALSLQFSYEKSTWQAGEIMGKAHYKYLEIKARAEQYLRMLTEHFTIFKELIPNDLNNTLDPNFQEYIIKIIYTRQTPYTVAAAMKSQEFTNTTFREEIINKEFSKLQKLKSYSASALLNLLLDFDRWNNFRVLPKNLQEPSAFKRRNKNRLKKQLKNLTSINPFVLEKIIERFGLKKKTLDAYWYVPLVSQQKYSILKIDPSIAKNITQINKLGLFIFSNYNQAEEFSELVSKFNINEPKNCKEGLIFWPQYRLLVKIAINYTEIENIIPSRKYLDLATKDWDIAKVKKIKTKAP